MLKKKNEKDEELVKKKSKKELEEEKRQEGLQTSLDSTNKGFALLAKMGYIAGQSLGKDKSGRTEPIPIEVKSDRSGLGRMAAKQQIKEMKDKLKSIKKNLNNPQMTAADFRASQSQKLKAKKIEGDLYRSQKACRQLDMAKEFTEPIETWFWPPKIASATEENEEVEPKIKEIIEEEEEEEEEEIEIPSDEMLKIITEYLRTEYLFCTWCGITFENPDDLSQNCPGNTRDDHDDD